MKAFKEDIRRRSSSLSTVISWQRTRESISLRFICNYFSYGNYKWVANGMSLVIIPISWYSYLYCKVFFFNIYKSLPGMKSLLLWIKKGCNMLMLNQDIVILFFVGLVSTDLVFIIVKIKWTNLGRLFFSSN